MPNPAFKRDAAEARRPLILRWAEEITKRHTVTVEKTNGSRKTDEF